LRFLHTSDLHIGKRLKDQSLLDEQRFMLAQLLEIVREQEVDAILIAGDIYDKSIPSAEAVNLFDDFLTALNANGTHIFLIAGNHDSAERIDFASRILSHHEVYISGSNLLRVPLADAFGEVNVWLMPFMRSQTATAVLQDTAIDCSARNLILSHQFVIHGEINPEKGGSEALSIGGIDVVDSSIYDGFDYVALGHIHRPQQVGTSAIRYSGSPYRYDFGECNHDKGVWILDLKEKGNLDAEFYQLVPQRDLYRLECRLAELSRQDAPRDAYIELTLTDPEPVVDAITKVRQIYPNILNLILKHRYANSGATHRLTAGDVQAKTPEELFVLFFEEMNGAKLSEAQRKLVATVFEGGEAHEAAKA